MNRNFRHAALVAAAALALAYLASATLAQAPAAAASVLRNFTLIDGRGGPVVPELALQSSLTDAFPRLGRRPN